MTLRRIIPLAAVVVTAGLVFGQQPPPKKEAAKPAPGSLEYTLEKALRNSADIRAAEAKVRESEAELNRVRQKVLTRATALHTDLNLAKRMLGHAEQSFALTKNGMERGKVSQGDVLAAQALVEKQRGEVEKLESELKSLRGEFPARLVTTVGVWNVVDLPDVRVAGGQSAPTPAVRTPMMERVRKLLDQEVTMKIGSDMVPDLVKGLVATAKADIPVRVTVSGSEPVEIKLEGKLPVGAWLQALADSDPTITVLVRDYGLLVTTGDRIPEGALRVEDLWTGAPAAIKPKTPEEKKP